jgi:hypothetical protein
MRKRMFIGALVAALAVVLAGGLTASNMGFKLNYTLIATGQPTPEGGNSADGTNDISLPDFPQAGMATANDLRIDVGAAANGGISKLLRSSNLSQVYTGKGAGLNFNLVSGDGYRVKLTGIANVNYIVVGSHNPSLSHTLIATTQPVPEGGTSADGTNAYNYPYHSVAATANDLRLEIGAAANGGVSKLLRASNLSQVYTGKGAGLNFNLVPGAAYRVKLTGTTNVSFVPNHY